MKPFKIELSNSAIVTGLASIPPHSRSTPKHVPLVIGIHGGTYSASYFDADANHTASLTSDGLGVPFMAINRPGYKDTTAFAVPADSSFHIEQGKYFHDLIFPALWKQFGQPNGCSCLILLSHSLGVPGSIVAASMHAGEPAHSKSYPLGALIFSGFGTMGTNNQAPVTGTTDLHWPKEAKDDFMLGSIDSGMSDPEIYKQTEVLDSTITLAELADAGPEPWFAHWKEYAGKIALPVMVGMAEHDHLWQGTAEHVQDFLAGFPQSRRREGGVILGSPHCTELSYAGKGVVREDLRLCYGVCLCECVEGVLKVVYPFRARDEDVLRIVVCCTPNIRQNGR